MGAMDAFVGPNGQLMGLKVKPPSYPPLPPPRPPNLGTTPAAQTTPAPYEPSDTPPPPDPSNPPMAPYDPSGPLSGGGGGGGAGSAASSGNPGQAMPAYDPYVSSPNYGPNYGYVGSGGGPFEGYGPGAVNALNDAFVASGLGSEGQSGKGGIGSDWVSGGPIGTGGSWDPQGVAANIASGNPNIPPYLAASNLSRYGKAFQNFGGFANPNAGFAASTVAGAESGGNPFAVNQAGSGATGMNQWMNTPGNPRLTNMLNLTGGNTSPEMQGAFAASEIMGGGYPGVSNALNNPNASTTGMQGPLISQYEGLQGYPSQIAIDTANAARYAQSQSAFNTALRNNVAQGISQ
jgi:hypothetical protein